jgi:hypothetical protein
MTTATKSPFDTSMTFGKMHFLGKITWFGKLIIALATFGFAFPHVMDSE